IQAAEIAAQRTDRKNLGQALGAYQQLAQLYVLVGDFDKAREALRQAEATFTALNSSKNWTYYSNNWSANLERARGELFRAEGRFVEAEGAYRKGLRSLEAFLADLNGGMKPPNFSPYDRQRSERFREVLLRNIAQSLMGQGKNIDAEISLRRALRFSLERVGRNAPDTGTTLMLLSNCLGEQGRFADAARLAEEAVRSFQQAGATPESLFMANARRALASTYVAQTRYKEALATFEQMQAGLNGDPVLAQKLANGDLDWVLALLRTGNATAAETMARSMLDKAQRRNVSGSRLAEIRAFHGMALAASGQREAALDAFKQSIPKLIETRRSDEETGTGSVKRQQRLIAAIESYLNLLYESAHSKPDTLAAAAAESFTLADVARSSSVQQALTASAARASISDPALAELARREQDAQRRIGALGDILTQMLAAPPEQQLPQVQARMREDIDALKAERAKLKKEIEQRFPEYAELVDPKPATLAQAQKLLKPGEALATWYFGEEGGWVWATNKQGSVGFSSVPYNRKQIAQAVQGVRKALDPGVASIDDIPAFDVGKAHQLYAGLLQPIAPQWQGAQNLLAIPHADLGQLPLALLPTAQVAQPSKSAVPFENYRSVPWLARQLAVTQLPSVTALASLRRLPEPAQTRRAFIGFGDPLFNTDQAKQADKVAQAETGPAAMATRGSGRLKLRNVPQTANVSSAELGILPRLPDTSQEIREIAGVLQADPKQDIFLQKRATVHTVLNTDLTNRRVVMFATHGLVPGELDGLVQPALALTSPEVADPDSDGLLTMDKILTLKLNADWVVLSACNTAAGEGSGAEAVSGLGRAFFYAGTRAILVSNWPVETVAARKLMTDLFRRQVNAGGVAKAEALRQAMLGLIDGPGSTDEKTGRVSFSYAHPLFWAPFVVVGD
ncbi:MAG TPA: CHAT domain-containing tetratricopeptide repeat protein, partial [Rhodocyclaceae bacterium]